MKKQYGDMDLPGLKFKVAKHPNITFIITKVSGGLCWVGWDGIKHREPYASHWVKIYLERGDWIEKQ